MREKETAIFFNDAAFEVLDTLSDAGLLELESF